MKRGRKKQNRDIQIKFRMTEEEYHAFLSRLKESRLSQGEYLLHAALNIPIENYNFETTEDFTNLLYQIRKIGVNLNQIAYHVHKYDIPIPELVKILKSLDEISAQHDAMLKCVMQIMTEIDFQKNQLMIQKEVEKITSNMEQDEAKERENDDSTISKRILNVIRDIMPTLKENENPFEYEIDDIDFDNWDDETEETQESEDDFTLSEDD